MPYTHEVVGDPFTESETQIAMGVSEAEMIEYANRYASREGAGGYSYLIVRLIGDTRQVAGAILHEIDLEREVPDAFDVENQE